MPSWKKVITSGSEASLSSLYTSGNITGSNLNITGTISGSTISGSFIGDGSSLTGIAISGSMTSTGSFGELANILPLNAFETGVVLTSDGSATITLSNIIFITTNNGELILYE